MHWVVLLVFVHTVHLWSLHGQYVCPLWGLYSMCVVLPQW